ncbi:MAG: transcriptional regulator [Candidatus Muproteobacteria bacterium RBG_16_64_11]|uniref:mRNA interferase n=1 Tax=Candidatus Muproteobacteria bacterium RBG_16_64_11 TaxID=1817758 RepID=A0A1F6TB45_9PROT|nr:MAG: transcriptional regulator [Candidatus Muproteobacteria bacterium RBG_16_64_11]
MALVAERFDIFLVALDPTQGHEIRKTRPCVVISPDEMNRHIGTVIVAPMTTQGQDYPTRVPVAFRRKKGQIVLDQIRTVDKARLVKRLGRLDRGVSNRVLSVLQEMFAA